MLKLKHFTSYFPNGIIRRLSWTLFGCCSDRLRSAQRGLGWCPARAELNTHSFLACFEGFSPSVWSSASQTHAQLDWGQLTGSAIQEHCTDYQILAVSSLKLQYVFHTKCNLLPLDTLTVYVPHTFYIKYNDWKANKKIYCAEMCWLFVLKVQTTGC